MPGRFCLFVLIVSAQAFLLAQRNAPAGNLQIERSPMVVRASGVSYEGIAHTGMSLERLEAERTDKFWMEVKSDGTTYFRSEGLGVYRHGGDAWVTYPMFGLAVAAGWFAPQPDDRYLFNDIEGLGIGGGKVWMGSNGVGIIARDLRDGRWSRHDAKAMPLPGIHSTLLHADDNYVFALSGGPTGGWRERLPDVYSEEQLGPAVEVYSVRHGAWLRVVGVSRENVLEFGWTGYTGVSMPCDTRPLARLAFVPLESCTLPEYAKTARGEAGYELGRTFNEPGAPFRFVLRTKELDAAFKSMP
jgi:hypothetical protein